MPVFDGLWALARRVHADRTSCAVPTNLIRASSAGPGGHGAR